MIYSYLQIMLLERKKLNKNIRMPFSSGDSCICWILTSFYSESILTTCSTNAALLAILLQQATHLEDITLRLPLLTMNRIRCTICMIIEVATFFKSICTCPAKYKDSVSINSSSLNSGSRSITFTHVFCPFFPPNIFLICSEIEMQSWLHITEISHGCRQW